jgi:hypothetical protein
VKFVEFIESIEFVELIKTETLRDTMETDRAWWR